MNGVNIAQVTSWGWLKDGEIVRKLSWRMEVVVLKLTTSLSAPGRTVLGPNV